MTHAAAIAVSMLSILGSSRAAGQDQTVIDIRARERALADAMHARDRRRIEELLASDFVLRGSPDIDRETWIHNALTLCWGDRSDIDAFQTREHDDIVVASFELTFYVEPTDCRSAVLRSLITDVWTRHPDGWRLDIRHSGPSPSTDAGVGAQYGVVPQPPPSWVATGELSLVATGGNTSTRTIGLGGNVIHRSDGSSTRASIAFLSSESDDVTNARSLTAQARHGARMTERIELFGRGWYARDRFAGIDDRVVPEVGVAYTVSLGRHALTVEGTIGLTFEQRLDATELQFVTATGATNYAWTIRPGSELSEDFRLVADAEVSANWRATSTTAASVTLTQLLSLKASHTLEYRNMPVAGFGRTDMRTGAALVFSWQRRPTR
jgi:putative salt-induced outer membrane protein YdiY